MKILHTSDWHLGKIFHEFSFIDDQKEMLNQLLQELKNAEENNNPYDALFVAGDIYDRQIPPVEAVNLFSSFLFQVRNQFPKLELFFIAGNHDFIFERKSKEMHDLFPINNKITYLCNEYIEYTSIQDTYEYKIF